MQEVAVKSSEVRYVVTFDKERKGEEKVLIASDEESLTAFRYMFEDCLVAQDFKTQSCLEKHNLENYLKSRITPSDKQCLLECLEKIDFSDLPGTKIRLIDKSQVHKISQENVMISEIELPIKTKIGLFSGDVTHTAEIILDHVNQDHTEAILLTESCRQACMVSLNSSLGSDAYYHITEEVKKYRHIVQRGKDISIHTLPVTGKRNKGIGLCLFTIYQDSKLCLSGYYSVMYLKKGMRHE